jgi:hypothetical protein
MRNPTEYAPDASLLRHILHTATWDELKLRERLANDPIAAFMRTVKCRECGCPVTDCQCKKVKPVEKWI